MRTIPVCISSSGVLRLRSVRRLQPGLLYDSGAKQPAQLVEVHTPPSSSSFSSSSSLSSTLTNTGSQNPPSMSRQHSGKENISSNQPALWSSRPQWLRLSSGAAASWLQGGAACNANGQVTQSSPLTSLKWWPVYKMKSEINKRMEESRKKWNVNLRKGGRRLVVPLSVFLVLIWLWWDWFCTSASFPCSWAGQ